MKYELIALGILVLSIVSWCWLCSIVTGIRPTIERKLTLTQHMEEMNSIIDNATEYSQLLCIPSKIQDMRAEYKHKPDIEDYVKLIEDAKRDRNADIAKEKNLFAIRAGKKMVSFP